MKEIIKLPNRDNINVSLSRINEENEYILEIAEDITYRVIGTMDDIKAVDPSGGPFITVGYQVENYIIKKIYRKESIGGIVFVVEEINN